MNRRRFILAGVGASFGILAGCSGDENGEEVSPDGADDTATESGDDGDADTSNDEGGETDAVLYENLYSHNSEYAVTAEYSDPESGESGTVTARYRGDNYYVNTEPHESDTVYEIYHVDGDDYLVLNGEDCFLNPGSEMQPDTDVESQSDAQAYGSVPDPDVKSNGTTQIDGETVHIFEVTSEDYDGIVTLYISASSGYLRRVETEGVTADFHSWGDVDPITPPDMECQQLPG